MDLILDQIFDLFREFRRLCRLGFCSWRGCFCLRVRCGFSFVFGLGYDIRVILYFFVDGMPLDIADAVYGRIDDQIVVLYLGHCFGDGYLGPL